MTTIYNNRFIININEVIDTHLQEYTECFFEIYDIAQSKIIMSDSYRSSKEVLMGLIKYGLDIDSMRGLIPPLL